LIVVLSALPYNLICTGDKAKLGWTTVSKVVGAYMTKGGVKIMLNIVVDTNHGRLYAIWLKRGAGQFVGQCAGQWQHIKITENKIARCSTIKTLPCIPALIAVLSALPYILYKSSLDYLKVALL
jgi:hypothetical protein